MKLPEVPQRTTPGFAFSMVERALLECVAVRKFGKAEIEEVVSFFGGDAPACVFCGATAVQRWDHLIPVSRGGDTVLGNMVPACARCDDSKRDLSYEEWAVGGEPNSPRTRGVPGLDYRLSKIREYVAKYAYQPRTPEERLNAEELRQFELLRQDLRRLRNEFDAFIALFRQRTGLT